MELEKRSQRCRFNAQPFVGVDERTFDRVVVGKDSLEHRQERQLDGHGQGLQQFRDLATDRFSAEAEDCEDVAGRQPPTNTDD